MHLLKIIGQRRTGNINISEIFYSIQGEGMALGTPSIFIRTSGCNLRCQWCDTPYTSWKPEKNIMSISEIIIKVKTLTSTSGNFLPEIIITGGEPFLQRELQELIIELQKLNYKVTIETNATKYKKTTANFLSLSPKLINSNPINTKSYKNHEQGRINYNALVRFLLDCKNSTHIDYQFKFVVKYPNDHLEILKILNELKNKFDLEVPVDKVLLMPEGRTPEEVHTKYSFLTKICMSYGFRLTPRLHIDIWRNKRGV